MVYYMCAHVQGPETCESLKFAAYLITTGILIKIQSLFTTHTQLLKVVLLLCRVVLVRGLASSFIIRVLPSFVLVVDHHI